MKRSVSRSGSYSTIRKFSAYISVPTTAWISRSMSGMSRPPLARSAIEYNAACRRAARCSDCSVRCCCSSSSALATRACTMLQKSHHRRSASGVAAAGQSATSCRPSAWSAGSRRRATRRPAAAVSAAPAGSGWASRCRSSAEGALGTACQVGAAPGACAGLQASRPARHPNTRSASASAIDVMSRRVPAANKRSTNSPQPVPTKLSRGSGGPVDGSGMGCLTELGSGMPARARVGPRP